MRVLLLTLALACANATPPSAAPPPPDAAAPQTVDGAAVRALLTRPGSRVRLVNFWATWCGPCVAELPTLTALARRHPDVEVILVNVDPPAVQPHKVAPVLRAKQVSGVTSLLLVDGDPLAALRSAVDGWPDAIPVTTVVDRAGHRTATWVEALPVLEVSGALAAAASSAPR